MRPHPLLTALFALALSPAALAQDGDNPWSDVTEEAGAAEEPAEDEPAEEEPAVQGASATRPDAESEEEEEEEAEPEAEPEPEPEAEPEPEPEAEPEPEPEPEPQPEPEPAGEDEEAAAAMFEPNPFMGRDEDLPELRYELSLELGSLLNGDAAYDLFDGNNVMPSWGLRLGARVHDRVAVVAGWHRVRRGADVSVFIQEDDADFEQQDNALRAAFLADELTLGPKVDYGIEDILYPYALAQLLVVRGTMRLDDDPDIDTNPGQVSASGLNAGVLAMGGFEVRLPRTGGAPITASWHLEMGYGWLARAGYGEFGTMKPGGFAVRSGLGVRF